jgi:hydroxymethylpyrimidine/phosphomethylpyrimidine kinase
MNRVRVVAAAIWCRITTTTLAAAIAASPAYAAEPEKTAKRAGKFVEKTATRAGKFTEKTAKRAVKFTEKTAKRVAKAVKKPFE